MFIFFGTDWLSLLLGVVTGIAWSLFLLYYNESNEIYDKTLVHSTARWTLKPDFDCKSCMVKRLCIPGIYICTYKINIYFYAACARLVKN